MGIFATRARHIPVETVAGVELSEELRAALPPRFDAVAEALAWGVEPVDACTVVGRDLALDGVSLGETLEGLSTVYRLVCHSEPGFAATRAISVAWSESTLGYLHQLSCEDPLTGLASLAHVRSRLADLYRLQRDDAGIHDSHALVVVDLPPLVDEAGRRQGHAQVLTHALRASRLGQSARTVFSGAETIGRFGLARVVVIAARDERLGQRIALLRRMLAATDEEGRPARIWIEGLPDSERAAASLLDELTRL